MNNTTVGVDLAKGLIQVCVFSQQKVVMKKQIHKLNLFLQGWGNYFLIGNGENHVPKSER